MRRLRRPLHALDLSAATFARSPVFDRQGVTHGGRSQQALVFVVMVS
jgi:hypothetical protein